MAFSLRTLSLLAACAALLATGFAAPSQSGIPWTPSPAPDVPERRISDLPQPIEPKTPEPPARHAPEPYLIAHVKAASGVALRARPAGSVSTRLGPRTEFGSPRALAVVARKGRWLGVVAPELGNGNVGWIDARAGGLRYSDTAVSLEVDLSERELRLRRGRRIARRVSVTVGAPGSPTPTGRFAVTDKLSGPRFSPYYGCCILALSGRQPNLPRGWTGGDRLAIHGTPDESGIGGAASAGCLRAAGGDLRLLMETVPLGTPVFVHP